MCTVHFAKMTFIVCNITCVIRTLVIFFLANRTTPLDKQWVGAGGTNINTGLSPLYCSSEKWVLEVSSPSQIIIESFSKLRFETRDFTEGEKSIHDQSNPGDDTAYPECVQQKESRRNSVVQASAGNLSSMASLKALRLSTSRPHTPVE